MNYQIYKNYYPLINMYIVNQFIYKNIQIEPTYHVYKFIYYTKDKQFQQIY
jgi:hypothetical protein